MKGTFLIATTAIAVQLSAVSLAVAETAEAKHNAPTARPAPPHAAVHALGSPRSARTCPSALGSTTRLVCTSEITSPAG
jgi:hypothetical protein